MRGRLLLFFWLGSLVAGSAHAEQAQPRRVRAEEAVSLALERNLELLARRHDVDIAAARIVTARVRPNPYFQGGADYLDLLGSDFKNDPSNGAGPSEWNLRLDFPVVLGGKRKHRIGYAKADYSVSELLLLNSVRELRFAVQTACVSVLLEEALLDLARQDLSIFKGIVQINGDRVRAGDLAESELMRTQLAARERANGVRRSELKVQLARMNLQLLLGADAAEPLVDVNGPLRRGTVEEHDLETLKAEAFAGRPDVLALAAAENRADADIQLQRALGWIDLNAGVQFHHQYGYADGSSLGFFLGLPIPLFDRNQGEIQRSRSTKMQAQAQLSAFRASVVREVAGAFATYEAARQLLEAIESGMTAEAREVRDASEYAYRRGEISFVEFLDAQRAFNQTMGSYQQALAGYALALYRLEYVTGTVEP